MQKTQKQLKSKEPRCQESKSRKEQKGKKGLQLSSTEVWMKIIKALQNTSRMGAI